MARFIGYYVGVGLLSSKALRSTITEGNEELVAEYAAS